VSALNPQESRPANQLAGEGTGTRHGSSVQRSGETRGTSEWHPGPARQPFEIARATRCAYACGSKGFSRPPTGPVITFSVMG